MCVLKIIAIAPNTPAPVSVNFVADVSFLDKSNNSTTLTAIFESYIVNNLTDEELLNNFEVQWDGEVLNLSRSYSNGSTTIMLTFAAPNNMAGQSQIYFRTDGLDIYYDGFETVELIEPNPVQIEYDTTDENTLPPEAHFGSYDGVLNDPSAILTLYFSSPLLVMGINFAEYFLTSVGTVSDFEYDDGDHGGETPASVGFIFTPPSNSEGTAVITLYASGQDGSLAQIAENDETISINYDTRSNTNTVNFSMRVCAVSKWNETKSNNLFTGSVGNLGYQDYSLKTIEFIINNVFDKTYKISTPKSGLMFFYLPQESTQVDYSLLAGFLLKKEDMIGVTGEEITSPNIIRMFNYISTQIFPILRKGGQVVSEGENATFDLCETKTYEGRLQLSVKNCLFELSLSF